jgi:hypothetical protein
VRLALDPLATVFEVSCQLVYYSRKMANGGSIASRRVPAQPTSITTDIPPSTPINQMAASG